MPPRRVSVGRSTVISTGQTAERFEAKLRTWYEFQRNKTHDTKHEQFFQFGLLFVLVDGTALWLSYIPPFQGVGWGRVECCPELTVGTARPNVKLLNVLGCPLRSQLWEAWCYDFRGIWRELWHFLNTHQNFDCRTGQSSGAPKQKSLAGNWCLTIGVSSSSATQLKSVVCGPSEVCGPKQPHCYHWPAACTLAVLEQFIYLFYFIPCLSPEGTLGG